ncbi:beta-glucan synthesis-associated protein-domain-containing protein [Pholiota molesta]|nr:beta-glucan synthesis-associated protein-domain-containing protein [Pholiota molesta]
MLISHVSAANQESPLSNIVMSIHAAPASSTSRGDLVLQPNYFTSSVYVKALRDDISTLVLRYHEAYNQPGVTQPFALFKTVWSDMGWNLLQFRVFDNHYASLADLADSLTSPNFAPLQPHVRYILSRFQKDLVFLILPKSELGPMNPRELPREIYADDGMVFSEAQKRKGRPARREKGKKARIALEDLDDWISEQQPSNEESLEMDAAREKYEAMKKSMLDGIDAEDVEGAGQEVLQRLKEARALVDEGDGSVGVSRLEREVSGPAADVSGSAKVSSPGGCAGIATPFLSSPMAFFGPNAPRRYINRASDSTSSTNLLNPASFNARNSQRESSTASASLVPYDISPSQSVAPSISDKFSLSPDPTAWGSNLSPDFQEPDDYLHNPGPGRERNKLPRMTIFSFRGVTNVGCLAILCVGLLTLFAGYPLITYFTSKTQSKLGGFNIGGINASGQVPMISGNWGLIDKDTPNDALTTKSYVDPNQELQLVFSDEFNVDGRTFYPGDDPYWEAVDLHYWATNNLEWYDPEAVTTKNGYLQITLSQKATHGLNYQGGMVSTWNKFCFTGGLVQTSVVLPGINNVVGLWPAVWTMGNLGRAGYGASLEGMWPFTYDACDVGTAPNQTLNGQPQAAMIDGDPTYGGALSFLPGQKLSRCTCKGESHPGPMHSDGTFVGRAAPEIDILEAQVSGEPLIGQVSQSAQWAPFNAQYEWFNTSDTFTIFNSSGSKLNPYVGGVFQQATSVVSDTNQQCYELTGGCSDIYGFEYNPGFDNAYITWISSGTPSWNIKGSGLAADTRVEISARPIPQEPLYLIMNLGMSENFGVIDFEHLTFPTTMRVDWIRVYQNPSDINVGCDPKDFPTEAYIEQYIEAYTNPNLTTWVNDFQQPFPKNSFLGQC